MITLKVHGTFEWIKKKKIQPHAVYKRLTLDLKTQTDWEWRDKERYFKQTETTPPQMQ